MRLSGRTTAGDDCSGWWGGGGGGGGGGGEQKKNEHICYEPKLTCYLPLAFFDFLYILLYELHNILFYKHHLKIQLDSMDT